MKALHGIRVVLQSTEYYLIKASIFFNYYRNFESHT